MTTDVVDFPHLPTSFPAVKGEVVTLTLTTRNEDRGASVVRKTTDDPTFCLSLLTSRFPVPKSRTRGTPVTSRRESSPSGTLGV